MTRSTSEDGFQAMQAVMLLGIGFLVILVLQGRLDSILDFLRVRAADLHPVLGWRY